MIPRLNLSESPLLIYLKYLEALRRSPFSGEIRDDYGSRVITATDNSIYQILPQAVVFPKTPEDIIELFHIANREPFQSIKFSPRGGGTGTNGQSLNDGIIIDCSKYMNNILEVNLKERWVRVQPGVVLDQLNDYLKPYGVFFAPSLSTSNRATLGGMINTDACGQGSRVYGRTSNHVLEISFVLSNGEQGKSGPCDSRKLETVKKREDRIGQVYRQIDDIVTTKKNLIEEIFPKMSRFLTGYNLAKVYEDNHGLFNLNAILSGSEGTLAVVTEAKLNIIPIPKYKKLLAIKYQSFNDALKAAKLLLSSDPTAIETIDEKILSLAKEDEIYHKVKDFIADEGKKITKTINLVEFTGNNRKVLDSKVRNLCRAIKSNVDKPHHAIGYYVTDIPSEIADLWTLRKKGVGLLGNTKGARKPIPFIEDTAVPPQNLASYIREFKALLKKYHLDYAMFGHVDVGCLHVRPALNLQDLDDEKLIREISDQVVSLVRKYGGVMWAEHGKGFRSEYTPLFFGEELYQDLRRIKESFDPENKLNPGKVVTPYSMPDQVVRIEAPLRGHKDRTILPDFQLDYESAIACNGNGACFNYRPTDIMCPSMKITRDRIHSPKGRAGMLREWLRQLSLAQPHWKPRLVWRMFPLWYKAQNTLRKSKDPEDFSREVYEAMNGCLACKACATQCPIHVNIPELRTQFLELYYTRYLRPLKDYFVSRMEIMGQWLSQIPNVSNVFLSSLLVRIILNKIIGLVDVPLFSAIPLSEGLKQRNAPKFNLSHLKKLTNEKKEKSVVLLPDAFTSFYESNLVFDTYDFLTRLGYTVYVAPLRANGKPLHVKGFLKKFRKVAAKNTVWLSRIARYGLPIIGIDPSVVLTYRDEYPRILGRTRLEFNVLLPQEWLITQADVLQKFRKSSGSQQYYLLGHCMEKTGALSSQQEWEQVFSSLGLQLTSISVGCCGMAGTYGHETLHYAESKGIYDLSWKEHIPSSPQNRQYILTTGYSCRSQVKRFDGFTPRHPLQALLEEISSQQEKV